MTPTIDLQAHLTPDALQSAFVALAEEQPAVGFMLEVVRKIDPKQQMRRVDDVRVATMDAAGVDVQVLSTTPPWLAMLSAGRAAELAAAINDELIEAAGRYPGRFLVVATLPFPHVAETVAEIERLAANPLVRGGFIDCVNVPYTIDEARFDSVYAKLAELRMPVVLHPAPPMPPGALYEDLNVTSIVGMMANLSSSALRLILGGTLDRVPDLDVIVPQLGGTIPFLMQRAIDLNLGGIEHDLLHYFRNRMWLDTNNLWPPALRCAIDTVGVDRIVFGSDYPLRRTLDVAVRDIRDSWLDDDEKSSILGGVATRWFGPEPLRADAAAMSAS